MVAWGSHVCKGQLFCHPRVGVLLVVLSTELRLHFERSNETNFSLIIYISPRVQRCEKRVKLFVREVEISLGFRAVIAIVPRRP